MRNPAKLAAAALPCAALLPAPPGGKARRGKDPYVVLSVGGFLGLGAHLVVVPYANLKVVDNKVMLPGGTKAALEKLPQFEFAPK